MPTPISGLNPLEEPLSLADLVEIVNRSITHQSLEGESQRATWAQVLTLMALTLITGPESSEDLAVPAFDGETGKLLRATALKIAANDRLAFLSSKNPVVAATDGATVTFDCALSNDHEVTVNGNRQLALANVEPGQKIFVKIQQGVAGNHIPLWWSGIRWPNGAVPSFATDPGHYDWFGFRCTGVGAYDGFIGGRNYIG